jgi:large subunit ribosomal protein L24
MAKIRKGDTVQILAGRDRGQRGKVATALPDGRLLVEGRNLVTKHSKPRPVRGTRGLEMTPGGIVRVESPVRRSNAGLVCPSCNEVTRVGFTITDGVKTRTCKKCGKDIPTDG